jgi:adenine-specific DNA-methyltransferase
MMYPRLKIARNMLSPNGVMFISIDEREYSNLREMCGEIFGEENIVGTIVWKNVTDNNPTNIATEHEYLIVVARDAEALDKEWKSTVSDVKDVLVRIGTELNGKNKGAPLRSAYGEWFKQHKSELWPLDRYKCIDEGGVYTGSQSVHNPGKEGYRYDVIHPRTMKPCKQPLMGYRFPKETMDDLLAQGRVLFGDDESKIVELKVYASEFEDKLSSVIELDGRLGAYDLREDFPEQVKAFSNPKPVRLLMTFFPFVLKANGDTVLDFFAGSGATAKAVFALNATDGVRRQFCLVQLPEPLDPNDKEQKSSAQICDSIHKPRNIAELTKERVRRAGQKTKDQTPLFASDCGFRVLKLASSNIRAWEANREDLSGTLERAIQHLVPDRGVGDVLYELLLKLGLDLCVPIERRTVAGKEVHAIGGGVLLACLGDAINAGNVEALAHGIVEWHKALAPAGQTTCVFRDSAFADDVAKTNLAAILEQHGLSNVRSL